MLTNAVNPTSPILKGTHVVVLVLPAVSQLHGCRNFLIVSVEHIICILTYFKIITFQDKVAHQNEHLKVTSKFNFKSLSDSFTSQLSIQDFISKGSIYESSHCFQAFDSVHS